MKLKLGEKTDRWSQKGQSFLLKRLNARNKEDSKLAELLIGYYLSGGIDRLNKDVNHQAAKFFNTGLLDAESIVIIILGRKPVKTRNGLEEQSASLTQSEIEGQKILAGALTNGRRYKNKGKNRRQENSIARKESISTKTVSYTDPAETTFQSKLSTPLNTTCEESRTRLVHALRQRPDYMNEKLESLKTERHQLERPDYLWHSLLVSFSTMGNSRGFKGLIENKNNYERVTYQALESLPVTERIQRLEETLLNAKVRIPLQKAQWLSDNFDMIQSLGGLEAAKQTALNQHGVNAKIKFMKQFAGIGDKYARNLWMDVYHPDFHESIAIDERIKKVTTAMGCEFNNYDEHEQFFLGIAQDAGLNGWELDRLLYNYTDYYLQHLNSTKR